VYIRVFLSRKQRVTTVTMDIDEQGSIVSRKYNLIVTVRRLTLDEGLG
jgi:hypothetical protein